MHVLTGTWSGTLQHDSSGSGLVAGMLEGWKPSVSDIVAHVMFLPALKLHATYHGQLER